LLTAGTDKLITLRALGSERPLRGPIHIVVKQQRWQIDFATATQHLVLVFCSPDPVIDPAGEVFFPRGAMSVIWWRHVDNATTVALLTTVCLLMHQSASSTNR
jgi:hypothetical protein